MKVILIVVNVNFNIYYIIKIKHIFLYYLMKVKVTMNLS